MRLPSSAAVAAAALAVLTGLRLLLAARFPLAPDEAYYWVWSRALAPGYFDHPPMIALWIRAGTAIAGESPLGIRLLGPLGAALGSVLLWDAGRRLPLVCGAGLVAPVLLNATLAVGVGAILATPDAPLMLFWTAALWAMARIAGGGSGAWWLAAGLFVGLAAASKYTAALFAAAIALWLLAAGGAWRRRPEPYAGGVVALIVFAPVLWWNAGHGWVSILKQGGRAGAWVPARAPQFLAELVAGQFGLATPLIFVLLVAGAAHASRRAWRMREPVSTLLAALAGLPALVFVQHALGDRVQANWPVIAYPAAALAAAGLCGRGWRRLYLPAVALGLAMTAAVYVEAALAPLPLPVRLNPIALQTGGWRELAAAVEAARRQVGAGFVAADNYGLAAELARLLPDGVAVVAIGPRWANFNLPRPAIAGEAGLLVEPGAAAAPVWPRAQSLGGGARVQNGRIIHRYSFFRAIPDPATDYVLLPRPSAR
jgi:4-amino-4-deoxy-L-arabinose transferase-like glycosyltransferase